MYLMTQPQNVGFPFHWFWSGLNSLHLKSKHLLGDARTVSPDWNPQATSHKPSEIPLPAEGWASTDTVMVLAGAVGGGFYEEGERLRTVGNSVTMKTGWGPQPWIKHVQSSCNIHPQNHRTGVRTWVPTWKTTTKCCPSVRGGWKARENP